MSRSDEPAADPFATGTSFEAPRPEADVARCPACLSPIRSDQRYCLECGERLSVDEIPPPPGGGSAFSDRRTSLLVIAAVALVIAGAGLSWVALRDRGTSSDQVAVVTTGEESTASATGTDQTTDTTATDPAVTDTGLTDTGMTDTGMTDTGASAGSWPAGQSGFAVILASKDAAAFTEADARSIADQATTAGVELVGVLDSSSYPSLNPGYWAVFSGPYTTLDEAKAAVTTIQPLGYPEAYAREVTP